MTAEERKEAERVINEMIAETVKRKTYEIRMNEYRELIKLILIRDTPRVGIQPTETLQERVDEFEQMMGKTFEQIDKDFDEAIVLKYGRV